MALTNTLSNFIMTVTLPTVSLEAVPLGAIKRNGTEQAPCVSNAASHVLLPEPWALRALNILIKKYVIWERLIKCFLIESTTVRTTQETRKKKRKYDGVNKTLQEINRKKKDIC